MSEDVNSQKDKKQMEKVTKDVVEFLTEKDVESVIMMATDGEANLVMAGGTIVELVGLLVSSMNKSKELERIVETSVSYRNRNTSNDDTRKKIIDALEELEELISTKK
jgi:hypothetical protein